MWICSFFLLFVISAFAQDRYGITPLWEAAQRGDAAMASKLIQAGADVNVANPQGETALLPAARSGSVETVKLLLDHGANPNQKENWRGETALMLAAAEGHTEVAHLLIARGADPNVRSTSFPLQDRDGIVGLQASLYWKGGLTALLFAARQGNVETGRALVDDGADMSETDTDFHFTPLMEAIFNRHLDFAQMLVERGANINDGSLYLLVDQRIDATFTRMLLDRGADVNVVFNNGKIPPRITYPAIRYGPIPQGSTPLLAAARAQDVRSMKMLLDRHADPNQATTVDHFTPLMAALAGGPRRRGAPAPNPMPAVQFLIEHGANVNAVNSRGMSAMHYAARAGNDAAVQLLADHGAKLDGKDRVGRTPEDMANGVMTAVTGADGPQHEATATLLIRLMAKETSLGSRQ